MLLFIAERHYPLPNAATRIPATEANLKSYRNHICFNLDESRSTRVMLSGNCWYSAKKEARLAGVMLQRNMHVILVPSNELLQVTTASS